MTISFEMNTAVPLRSRLAVGQLAQFSVAAASRAAAMLAGADDAPLDADRVAVAYSSDRWFRLDGQRPDAFAPLSDFFRTEDGWVRTHANYPHHAAVLASVLGIADTADLEAATGAFARRRSAEVAAAITQQGGLCVPVRREAPSEDAALREQPMVSSHRLGDAPTRPSREATAAAPLAGIRVLDLTRVIAGPVATRTLALLGAEVLRIDPPGMPEIPWQHLDTGHGKRSALLNVADPMGRARFETLLADADVVALGYRQAGLERLGLTPTALAELRPGLVVMQHTAWGNAHRRGFDSLVQAGSGISWLESVDGETPGALPAQALDHSAGYLLAAAAMSALAKQQEEGGSWLVETSLRRMAAELLGMRRSETPEPTAGLPDAAGHTQSFDIAGQRIVTAAPALSYAGAPREFAAPRPWGGDEAAWG